MSLLSETETEAETIARMKADGAENTRMFLAGEILGPLSRFASDEIKRDGPAFIAARANRSRLCKN